MKSTPFDMSRDYEPIPFDQEICRLAQELKTKGLDWHPHVGCFVWDPQKSIPVPSPFPNHIYFILNLNHFLKIFDSIERMKEKLVWIPTWEQARRLCIERKITDDQIKDKILVSPNWAMQNEIIDLYRFLLESL